MTDVLPVRVPQYRPVSSTIVPDLPADTGTFDIITEKPLPPDVEHMRSMPHIYTNISASMACGQIALFRITTVFGSLMACPLCMRVAVEAAISDSPDEMIGVTMIKALSIQKDDNLTCQVRL